jgi:hypothetical protein
MSFFSSSNSGVSNASAGNSGSAGTGFLGKLKARFGSIPLPILILVTIMLIIAVIVYIVYKVKKGNLKSTSLSRRPVIKGNPLGGDYSVMPAGTLPETSNGSEFSYSVWIFVDNVALGTDHKTVLYRGSSNSMKNGYIYVYMDSKTNKMYCSVRTNAVRDESASNLPSTNEPTLLDISRNKYFMKSSIEYIPMQRWVNVIYSIRENVLSTYLDGELYNVTSIHEMPLTSEGARPLIVPPKGDVMLGGKAGKEGVNGYIGDCRYFNYGLTLREAQSIYKRGPYKTSWLAAIGLGQYGMRSPLYRVQESDDQMD